MASSGTTGVSYPPNAATDSWSVPRVSLPGLFSIQPDFATEWWYYVGTLVSDKGALFSLQFQVLRASLWPGASAGAGFTGIGWTDKKDGAQYLFSQGYGFGASTGGTVSPLLNSLVIPNAADTAFGASFSALLELVDLDDPEIWKMIHLRSSQAPNYTISYKSPGPDGGNLGEIGGTYTLAGNGTGYHSLASGGSGTSMAFSLELDLEDTRGTVMEGLSGYVGPLMIGGGGSGQVGGGSYECAQPLLAVRSPGTLTLGGTSHKIVGGTIWMDRQMVASPPGEGSGALSERQVANAEDLVACLREQATGGGKPLYCGTWIGISLDSGISFALAEFWHELQPQWISGTKTGHPPLGGFGNMFLKVDQGKPQPHNGGMFLQPRMSKDQTDGWDFDVNILDWKDPDTSPHWTSPLSGHIYATAVEIEFSGAVQAHGVPQYLYLYAVSECCENALPLKADRYFEGAAVICREKLTKVDPDILAAKAIGYAFVEEMGYNGAPKAFVPGSKTGN